jgi:succinate dehydrogenase hydrophobic anchor subunit
MNVRLYVWQRATAAIIAPLVLVHIAVIFYANRQQMLAPALSRSAATAKPTIRARK